MSQPAKAPVLIANRGEIAIRIARTCRAMGFPTVAVYSDADKNADHIRYCDFAVALGGTTPAESYLKIEKIIEAAQKTGAKYVHPGYGFLSERPKFVEACDKAGITFVGPRAESMEKMGDKVEARKTVTALGVSGVPGSKGVLKTAAEATTVAREIGFPVLLKAAAGGGGKGMRLVEVEAELADAFAGASREATAAFGDGSMYLEKFIINPHHVEIQVFGDGEGKAIHLGERECSVQRRHQKVWEETPAPILGRFPKTREQMFEAAIKITEGVRYAGAGTLEFIVDEKGSFYFLEMNTRLQVEHPVTEWVTGVDLVALQMRLAEARRNKQPFELPRNIERRGASIEVRLYAEDSERFLPAPGPLSRIHFPAGAFVRVDSAFHNAGEVSIHYDPMIAKLSVWGNTREEAMDRMRVALDETRVQRPKNADGSERGTLDTNLSFLKRLVRHPRVVKGDTTTKLIEESKELTAPSQASDAPEAALIGLAIAELLEAGAPVSAPVAESSPNNVWNSVSRREGVRS